MSWLATVTNIISRVPIERVLFPPRDRTKELERLLTTLGAPESQKEASSSEKATPVTQTPERVSLSGSTGIVTRAGLDPERLAWQEGLALGEVWLLEGHLKNNCVACGGDYECCWKHSDNVVRVADETLSMTTDPFWQNLKLLAGEIRSKSHPDDVKRGTYVAEYPHFAVLLSEFRVPLQKKAMESSKPQISLEEARNLAAEEAVKRVEEQWQLVQEPPDADLPGDTPMRQRAQELANRVRAGELSRSEAVAMLADDLAKEAK